MASKNYDISNTELIIFKYEYGRSGLVNAIST